MADIPRAGAIRGTTMRWAWTEGPTQGMVHEHVFHEDGTVEWHDAGSAPPTKPSKEAAGARGSTQPERVPYAAFEVTPEVGMASGSKDWFPLRGTFEVVG
jgi:hypothetical protein